MTAANASPTALGKVLISLGATLVLAGLAIMLFAPANGFGLDTGLVGGTAMPLGVLIAFYGLSVVRTQFGDAASFGERTAILSLAVTAVAGAYFFFSLQDLGWDVVYPDRRLRGVISNLITILVAGVIGVEILRRRAGTGTLEDERDVVVRHRATSIAYGVLAVLLAMLVVSLGYPSAQWLPLPTPASVAHGVILIILLAEMVRHATTMWIYKEVRI